LPPAAHSEPSFTMPVQSTVSGRGAVAANMRGCWRLPSRAGAKRISYGSTVDLLATGRRPGDRREPPTPCTPTLRPLAPRVNLTAFGHSICPRSTRAPRILIAFQLLHTQAINTISLACSICGDASYRASRMAEKSCTPRRNARGRDWHLIFRQKDLPGKRMRSRCPTK